MITAAPGFRGLPRVFWLLCLGMFVNRLGGGVFAFLSIYLARARGYQPAQAGVVVALYAAGSMVAGPVGGVLADRLGRRAMLIASTTGAAALMLGFGQARDALAIGALAVAVGFVTDLARPALQAAVADVVAPPDRRRAYGLLYWAINLGFACAGALAGPIADASFSALFVFDAATTLAFGLLVLVAVPETRPVRDAADAHAGYLGEVVLPFRDPAFLTFAGVQLLVLVVFAQFSVALPLDMSAHGLSISAVGRVLALNGVVIILVQPWALRLFARVPHHHLLAAGALLTGAGMGACALASTAVGAGSAVVVYVLAMIVLTCGEIGFSLAVPSLLAELAPTANRGGYQGAFQLTWGLAGLLAPSLGPYVFQTFGATTLWLGCLATGTVAAGLHAGLTGRATSRSQR